ncbi:hypothetical protein [Nocardia gamkensis]|uniref:Uncharacterized protein n=1 Tax=Nocardia gamkensis TaxID=352869 RepID=A0A7X6L4N6_9NOCA|nr:hypothetical protein [Nocardia gamkensis]NKY27778.1 hypothetical protein [Nocardia gamkensis]NQE67419.1 hypothetical protein [Nocardia gamkensis]
MNVDARHHPDDDQSKRGPGDETSTRQRLLDNGHNTTDAQKMWHVDTRGKSDDRPARPVTGADPPLTTAAERLRQNDYPDPGAIRREPDTGSSDHAQATEQTTAPPTFDQTATRDTELRSASDDAPDTQLESTRERIMADAAARAEQQLDEVCTVFGIDTPERIGAVAKARDVIAETLAPFTVDATIRLLRGVRSEIAEQPNAVVGIVYRDGGTIGMAIKELDADLYESHCRPVYLSRKTTEAVLQDQENAAERTFSLPEQFRVRDKPDPAEIPGASMRTGKHLVRSGLPVTTPGAHIILVDSGHKGTIQEQLNAAFPKPTYSGHYLFHVQAERDPHPDAKTGHVLHQSPERTFPAEADDPARIYAEKDPAVVFEHLLRGIMSTTHGHDNRGSPIHAREIPSLDQINPLVVAPEYADRGVRIAIMDIAQRTVTNCARTIAELDKAGIDYQPNLAEQARTCTQRVRSWAHGHDTGDPAFNALADSFVRRADKDLIPRLRAVITDLELGEAATTAAWRGYQQLSLADKERYVEQLELTTRSPGSAPPEGTPHG